MVIKKYFETLPPNTLKIVNKMSPEPQTVSIDNLTDESIAKNVIYYYYYL